MPPPAPPPAVQEEALAALRRLRAEGKKRALVVLATGLGKTWLAAFDYAQLWDEFGRPPRLLFVAHGRVACTTSRSTCWSACSRGLAP